MKKLPLKTDPTMLWVIYRTRLPCSSGCGTERMPGRRVGRVWVKAWSWSRVVGPHSPMCSWIFGISSSGLSRRSSLSMNMTFTRPRQVRVATVRRYSPYKPQPYKRKKRACYLSATLDRSMCTKYVVKRQVGSASRTLSMRDRVSTSAQTRDGRLQEAFGHAERTPLGIRNAFEHGTPRAQLLRFRQGARVSSTASTSRRRIKGAKET